MKRNQKGFGAVEGLLVLIIVGLIGFIGYYVYHTRNNTNSTYNNSAATSSASEAATSSSKFVFKEIGVQITLPADLKNLAYSMSTSDGVAYLNAYTPEFETALHKCDPTTTQSSNSSFMSIAKMSGQYNENDNPGVGNLKQFSGFWISGASPNGIVCTDSASQSDKDAFQSQFSNSNAALREAFKDATLVK